eukprot:TRINITY_DN4972_c0_g1_i1.p2 TRINITY_DN4972_c0_g1~~TRINITY_DN4972_c0_g1_i1.p2  ORF type:complete len:360 (-),score=203.83 TRINITY_DN4972_c0_g1_i1:64-1143(-)
MAIDNLSGRLSAWVFKREFDFKLADILSDIEMVNNAVVELKKSSKFTKLLHVVLVLGNWMNGGYFGGAGKAYKLQSLLRLRDTKTADNKSNLLEHLISLFEKHDEKKGTSLMSWRDDMPNVFNGTKERLDLVSSNVEELKASVKDLEATLENEKDELFIEKMTAFTKMTGDRMQLIVDSAAKVRERFVTTSNFYGEDDANDDFVTFLGQFHNQWQEQLKKIEEKRAKEAMRQKKKRAFMPKAKRAAMGGTSSTSVQRQMDDDDDDGMLFKAPSEKGARGDDRAGGVGGKGGASMLKSRRNFKGAASTNTGGRAKPKVMAVAEYIESDSEDSVDYEGPMVGVKVASKLAAADDDDSSEMD